MAHSLATNILSHFLGYPSTLPNLFRLPIYPPTILLVTHLSSPNFLGQISTPLHLPKQIFMRWKIKHNNT